MQKISKIINSEISDDLDELVGKVQATRIRQFGTAALMLFNFVGSVTLASMAPGIFRLFYYANNRKGDYRKFTKKQQKEKVSRMFYYLKRHGLIEMKPNAEDIIIQITEKGKARLRRLRILPSKIDNKKRWNKKWWLVAADIPTKDYRLGADLLRRKLKELHFLSLQRTMWLYPFDVREVIQQLVDAYEISRFVTVMEINRLDVQDEERAKKYFKSLKVI